MTTSLWGLLTTFLLSTTAIAGPPPAHPADRESGVESRAEQAPSDAEATSCPIDLGLGLEPLRMPRFLEEEQSLSFEMPAPKGEGLNLRFRIHPTMTFYVSADLSGQLPRLDALDGESYWAPGLEFHVTRSLSVFVEDFQPTSAVTGGDEDAKDVEAAPSRSWDGHQVGFGVRWLVRRDLQVSGQLIAYTLSVSGRSDALGGMISVAWSF